MLAEATDHGVADSVVVTIFARTPSVFPFLALAIDLLADLVLEPQPFRAEADQFGFRVVRRLARGRKRLAPPTAAHYRRPVGCGGACGRGAGSWLRLYARTLAAIRAALEAAGVAFTAEKGGGAGVWLRKD